MKRNEKDDVFLNFDFKSIQKIKSNELEFFNKHKICDSCRNMSNLFTDKYKYNYISSCHKCHKGKIYNYGFNDFLLTNEWYDCGTNPFSLFDKHCFAHYYPEKEFDIMVHYKPKNDRHLFNIFLIKN